MSSNLHILADDSVKIFYTNHSSTYEGDSGLDLFFPKDEIILPRETKKINLEIACQMFEENNGKIRNVSYFIFSRSSIVNTPLILHNGTGIIDAQFTGKLIVCLKNLGDSPYQIKRGEKLTQICARNLEPFTFKLVDMLMPTSRNNNGFGSTGK